MSEEEIRLATTNEKLARRAKQVRELEDGEDAALPSANAGLVERSQRLSEPAAPVGFVEDDPSVRIARARESLAEKLDELRAREAKVRATVAPIRHLANPWVQVGIAACLGLLLGARRG